MKASQEQYEKDKQSPESQKHNKPGKDHATWPGDWPFSNEADLARQKREKKATGILRFGPVRPSIDPNPMNKDGNPYKETIWTVPFTEDQLLMKVQEEMWEALNAKNKMEFIYEWLDNVFFLELAMMEGPESLKEKIKQCSDYQGMKNLKRGRQPLPVIRTALNMPLNEVDNTDQFEREFLTKPEGGTMDQEKEKKELSKPLEMGVQPAEQESSEPTGGPDEKPEVVTPENKDKVDEEEKERKQPKGDESGLFAKPQTQTFGLKQRTGMSGKKFEI